MKLITFAKALKPFIKKDYSLEAIYREICSNSSIPFKSILKPIDLIKVVFLAKKYLDGEDLTKIISELDNNIFIFSTVTFDSNEQTIDCEVCLGDGSVTCRNCQGSGEMNCDDCDGTGENDEDDACDYCQGGGEVECVFCDGDGSRSCDNCDGKGYNDTTEYVPYEFNYYVSYDESLKITLEQKLLRNNTEEPGYNFKNTFLLSIDSVGVNEGDSESIDNNFENSTHLLEIITENVSDDLIYGNDRIIPTGFYNELDRFM
jgi:hypothetical protein